MTTDLFGKYRPPPFPVPRSAPLGMGEDPFALFPVGFSNAAICPDSVDCVLDVADALAVRKLRLRVAEWVAQESAMNAPFLAISRERWA